MNIIGYYISLTCVPCPLLSLTLIFLFAGYGRREAVEILLNAGANVHARDDGGLIPLHNACSFGHAEVVSLLLRAGADPNARDNWSYTPLHEGSNAFQSS